MGQLRQVEGLISAAPCGPRTLPRANGVFARQGVNYEKKVHKALEALAKRIGGEYRPSPWFEFVDANGLGAIALDGMFIFGTDFIVIEVKRTFVPEAETKLRGLYIPIVNLALKHEATPLIICSTLTNEARYTVQALGNAPFSKNRRAEDPIATLLWLGHGLIEWA